MPCFGTRKYFDSGFCNNPQPGANLVFLSFFRSFYEFSQLSTKLKCGGEPSFFFSLICHINQFIMIVFCLSSIRTRQKGHDGRVQGKMHFTFSKVKHWHMLIEKKIDELMLVTKWIGGKLEFFKDSCLTYTWTNLWGKLSSSFWITYKISLGVKRALPLYRKASTHPHNKLCTKDFFPYIKQWAPLLFNGELLYINKGPRYLTFQIALD